MLGPHRLPCETLAPRSSSEIAPGERRWVLPVTILGSSLSFIDGSVVSVALPGMQRGLETGLATIQWVVNGYLLSLASLILLGGSLGDRFGRRKIFLVGLVGFAAASLACGLAPSANWLVAGRVIQGAAAALLMPASLAMISVAYAGEARGRAIGTWAAAGAITTALGPVIGGWLVDSIGWRSIFFVNLPIAAAALLLALRLPQDSGTPDVDRLDIRGTLLAITALVLLSFGLVSVGDGWHARGAIAIVAAMLTIWWCIRTEAKSPAPMMPLSLFRNHTFAGANGLTVLLYAALSGAMFVLPYLLIDVHHYSATASGAAFLPFSVLMGIGSRWSGGLVERTGPRLLLILGSAVTGVGFVLLGLSGNLSSYWTGFLPGLIIVGVGMTLSVAPLTTAVFDSAPAQRSGTASGINNAGARIGGLLAVAALGLAFGGAGAASMQAPALARAYSVVMFCAAALAALSAVTAAMTIRPGAVSANHRT